MVAMEASVEVTIEGDDARSLHLGEDIIVGNPVERLQAELAAAAADTSAVTTIGAVVAAVLTPPSSPPPPVTPPPSPPPPPPSPRPFDVNDCREGVAEREAEVPTHTRTHAFPPPQSSRPLLSTGTERQHDRERL